MPELSTFIFSADFIQKLEILHIQNMLKEHNRLISDFKSKESKIHGLKEVDDKVKACRATQEDRAAFLQKNQQTLHFLMNRDEQLTNLNRRRKDIQFTLESCDYNLNLSYFRCIFLCTPFKEYQPPKAKNLKKMTDEDMYAPSLSLEGACLAISVACTITGGFPFILAATGAITLASTLWFTPLLVIAAISLIAAFVVVYHRKINANDIKNETSRELKTNEDAISDLINQSTTGLTFFNKENSSISTENLPSISDANSLFQIYK